MADAKKIKVAIVHDWLLGGGAERVVMELHRMFPDAPIYTSYTTDEWRQKLDNKVVTGYLQRWPFSKLRKFLPILRAIWFSSLKLDDYDLVISSSSAEAKGIKTSKNTLHVNYCHSPTHYYWVRYQEYLNNPGFGMFDWLARIGLKLLVGPLKRWDYKAAQRPDFIIANSIYTQQNIKKYYGRESVVIHPPVDTERFKPSQPQTRSGFVTAGRQTPYMRKDLAVLACTQLGLPLKVIGQGPEHNKLMELAGDTIEFLTNVNDQQIVEYFQAAEALILPGQEDFGITGVEALAAGAPLLAYANGGSLDYLIPGKTGEFFDEQTVDSLKSALSRFEAKKYSSAEITKQAQKFSVSTFHSKFNEYLESLMKACK